MTDGGEELGKAQIPIRATLDKLDGDLEQARKKVESSLGGTLASIGNKVADIGKAVVIGGAVAAAAAVAGIGVAAFNAGMQLDDAYDKIAVGTDATGVVLDGLKDDFTAVFKDVPVDADTVAGAITELNSRLDATGQPLQDMAKGLALSAKLMGGDATQNAATLAKMMGSWNISNEEGAATLDKLFVATQKSGISLEQLTGSVQQYGPALRAMGFGLDESIALMANFEKAGIESGQVMAGMKLAAGKFAKAGVDVKTGFLGAIDSIKNAKTSTAALSQGMALFGARAAPAMVDAIRSGKFALEDMVGALQDSEGAIESTSKATEDWPEKWAKLKNIATVALAPIGEALMKIAGVVLDAAGPAIEKLAGIFENDVAPVIENVALAIQTMIAGDWDAPWEELFPPAVADTIEGIISTVQNVVLAIKTMRAGDWDAPWDELFPPVIAAIIAGIINACGLFNQALAAVQSFLDGSVIPVLREVWGWLQNQISSALTTVSGLWTGTLKPALEKVWDFLTTNIVSAFQTAWTWLQTSIPNAIQKASDFWTNTLKPALEKVWSFLEVNVFPAFQTAWNWLQDKIPKAIETARDFWENKLKGALETVWNFLTVNIFSAFQTAWNWLQTNLPLAIAETVRWFNEELVPAMGTTRDYIVNELLPKIQELAEKGFVKLSGDLKDTYDAFIAAKDSMNEARIAIQNLMTTIGLSPSTGARGATNQFWSDVLEGVKEGGPLQRLEQFFIDIKKVTDDVTSAVNWLNSRLQALKDLIASIKLPDFLDPGSPTPLELGIIGINAALREMNSLWGDMASQPMMRMGAMMPTMPGQPTLGGLPLGERVVVEVNGNGGATPGVGNVYNIYPSYREYESEGSLVQTVRMLQMGEG